MGVTAMYRVQPC